MNCCDAYGNCRQGHGCPIRATPVVNPEPPFTCKYCGAPSWLDPHDQTPPPDYCHESDHGEPLEQ